MFQQDWILYIYILDKEKRKSCKSEVSVSNVIQNSAEEKLKESVFVPDNPRLDVLGGGGVKVRIKAFWALVLYG